MINPQVKVNRVVRLKKQMRENLEKTSYFEKKDVQMKAKKEAFIREVHRKFDEEKKKFESKKLEQEKEPKVAEVDLAEAEEMAKQEMERRRKAALRKQLDQRMDRSMKKIRKEAREFVRDNMFGDRIDYESENAS